MQRFLTAATVVSAMALATTGLAVAQTSTAPYRGAAPSSSSATTPGMTTPSTGAATTSSSAANTGTNGMDMQSPETIKQAQQQLKTQGLYNGAIDGQWGPETASALSRFQQKNGLPQNAQLDQATMGRLMGNSASPSAGSGSSIPPSTMNPSMTPSTGGSSATNPAAGGTRGTGNSGTGATGH